MVVFSGGSLLGEPDRVAYFHFAESEGAMNKDIIRMAKEAGMGGMLTDVVCTHAELERFAELVRASEREACAEVCVAIANKPSNIVLGVALDCATAIRARGNE